MYYLDDGFSNRRTSIFALLTRGERSVKRRSKSVPITGYVQLFFTYVNILCHHIRSSYSVSIIFGHFSFKGNFNLLFLYPHFFYPHVFFIPLFLTRLFFTPFFSTPSFLYPHFFPPHFFQPIFLPPPFFSSLLFYSSFFTQIFKLYFFCNPYNTPRNKSTAKNWILPDYMLDFILGFYVGLAKKMWKWGNEYGRRVVGVRASLTLVTRRPVQSS